VYTVVDVGGGVMVDKQRSKETENGERDQEENLAKIWYTSTISLAQD
jgi:hypothetical protein